MPRKAGPSPATPRKPRSTETGPAPAAPRNPAIPEKGAASQARDASLKAIARELQAARSRAGLSISELHRQTGISRTVLQGYEAARFAPGTLELRRLCEALKATPNRVLFGDERPMDSKPLLASYVGDVTRAAGTARLAVIVQVLTSQELSAFLTLIEGLVLQRLGGPEELKIAMEAVDVMLGAAFDESMGADLQRLGEAAVERIPAEKIAELEELGKRAERLKARRKRSTGR
jgi:transcriptional regulator with XRE-family HTH domain